MGRIIIDSSQYEPKPIVGYADQISVAPGESVRFHVSCDGAAEFQADMVRLIHGDLHGAGPGFKEEVVESDFSGTYPGVKQETYPGSYMIVEDRGRLGGETGLSLQAMVMPTTPAIERPQALISKWSEDEGAGWALYIDETGHLSFKVGDATVRSLSTPLLTRVWYFVGVSFDPETGGLTLFQEPVVGIYNSRIAIQHPTEDLGETLEETVSPTALESNEAALVLAGWEQIVLDSGRTVVSALFNGKIDRPRIATRALSRAEMWRAVDQPLSVPGITAAWNFSSNITNKGIESFALGRDASTNRLDGRLVNMPTRGVTGYNWDGSEYSYRHAPDQYGAIHFHDDDLADCEWDATCEFTVPEGLQSGIYAARVRARIEDVDEEDYLCFFVRPPRGHRNGRVAYIAPTASYLAYANDQMAADAAFIEVLSGAVPHMGEQDLARHQHREYGSSMYDVHSDGSGVCYSTWLRPILTVRPKYRHSASRVWQFNADLHLIDWFDRMGYTVDVLTDHDLHEGGLDVLRDYRVAVTGSHPEYYSGPMLDAVHGFLHEGGRVMYLGGNGFYWTTAFFPEDPRIVEVRRWGGTEAWTAEPGQHYLSFTGEMGGLWRNRGRAPQKLVGVGFVAQGLDVSTYFLPKPDGFLPETEWILEGIGRDERIGDFGLEQGGAAGVEIDWYDPTIGSPGWAHIVAASEGHSRLMLEVRENISLTWPHMGGDMDPKVRADMVYFKTPNDGAVFSSSSISWCGSLSHNDYDNNVSRIMRNVVERFTSDKPLP